MFDPKDPGNGCFIWIDEMPTDETSNPPRGYSEAFSKLWRWSQHYGYQWVRIVEWGDKVTELETVDW